MRYTRLRQRTREYHRFTTRCTPNIGNYGLSYRQFLYKVMITILCRTNQSGHATCQVDHFYPCYMIEGITWEIESRQVLQRGVERKRRKERQRRVGRPIESRELHDPLCSITLHPRIRIQGLLLGVLKFTTVSESRGCEKCMARCTTIGMPRVAFPSPHVTDTTRYNSPSYYL